MTRKKFVIMLVAIVIAVGLVAFFGSEYNNEAKAFLRALLRAI